MIKEKIIFSIDNPSDLHTQAKFLRYVDTLSAMHKLQGALTICTGSYKGDLEPSYMMDRNDFMDHIADSGYTDGQETLLVVPGDTRQNCHMLYKDSVIDVLGPMVQISKEEVASVDNWTYVHATKLYFTTKS